MRLCVIAAVLLVSACQLAFPEKPQGASDANPITSGPITSGPISVTTLDAPPAVAPDRVAADPTPVAAEPAEPQPDAAPDPIVAPVAAPSPPPLKSESQQACERGGGAWVSAGTSGTMSCQTPQRDGGTQCRRDSDCDGQCLARSRTCAPFSPLFGCNDVLQDNGQRVTLCIE